MYISVRRCRWQQIEMVFCVHCWASILLVAFFTFVLVQVQRWCKRKFIKFSQSKAAACEHVTFTKPEFGIDVSHKRCHNNNNYRFIGIWLVLIECEAIIPPKRQNTEHRRRYIERTDLVICWRENVQVGSIRRLRHFRNPPLFRFSRSAKNFIECAVRTDTSKTDLFRSQCTGTHATHALATTIQCIQRWAYSVAVKTHNK